jgi:hypothetical protein
LRCADLRDADFAGRFAIVIDALPAAGDSRTQRYGRGLGLHGRRAIARLRLLLHGISLHVSYPAISGRGSAVAEK